MNASIAVTFSTPSSVRFVIPVIRSFTPPPTELFEPLRSKFSTDVPARANASRVVRVPGLLPGATMPPPRIETAPPIVPLPPSVAPLATLRPPVAADWLPLIRSVPTLTAVAPP